MASWMSPFSVAEEEAVFFCIHVLLEVQVEGILKLGKDCQVGVLLEGD